MCGRSGEPAAPSLDELRKVENSERKGLTFEQHGVAESERVGDGANGQRQSEVEGCDGEDL